MGKYYLQLAVFASLTACSANKLGGTCTQGFSGGARGSMPAILEYANHHCSAFVDIRATSRDNVEALIWTAAHCTPLSVKHSSGLNEKTRLSIQHPSGKYFNAIEIADPFRDRAIVLRNSVNELRSANEALADYLQSKSAVYNFPSQSACKMAGDTSEWEEDSTYYQRAKAAQEQRDTFLDKSTTELCFSPLESVTMTATISKNSVSQAYTSNASEAEELWRFLSMKFVGAMDRALTEEDREIQTQLVDLGRSVRFHRLSALVDLARWCRTDPSKRNLFPLPNLSAQVAVGFCKSLTSLDKLIASDIFEYHLGKDGSKSKLTLADFAKNLGHNYQEGFQINRSTKILRFLQEGPSWSGNRNIIFRYVQEKIEKEADRVSFFSNGREIFVTKLAPEENIDFTPVWVDFFRIFSRNLDKKIEIQRGDSGSMLIYKETIPLASLHAVNDDLTSGGSSLVSLPRRSEGNSNRDAQNVAKNRGSSKDSNESSSNKQENSTANRTSQIDSSCN